MGQREVLDFLKVNYPRGFTCKDIAKQFNLSNTVAAINLKSLRKYRLVLRLDVNNTPYYNYREQHDR